MTLQAIDHPTQNLAPDWWKNSVVYQIYPRSFLDSNHDGIGDLPGMIQQLDYLQNLGVDVIWLSPHFDSPNVDNGYDIRDYQKVMAELGTMADFDDLMAGLKANTLGFKKVAALFLNKTPIEIIIFGETLLMAQNPITTLHFLVVRHGNIALVVVNIIYIILPSNSPT